MISEKFNAVVCDVYEFTSDKRIDHEWQEKNGNKIDLVLASCGVNPDDILDVEYDEDANSLKYYVRVGYNLVYQGERPYVIPKDSKVLLDGIDEEPFVIMDVLYTSNDVQYTINRMDIGSVITKEIVEV